MSPYFTRTYHRYRNTKYTSLSYCRVLLVKHCKITTWLRVSLELDDGSKDNVLLSSSFTQMGQVQEFAETGKAWIEFRPPPIVLRVLGHLTPEKVRLSRAI